MQRQATIARPVSASLDGWLLCLLASVGVGLLIAALQGFKGFPTLYNSGGDNDSMMRIVQIRDFLAGQGWFDLHQYRMGPEGGFIMHWSRIVDVPVAGLILFFGALTGSVAMGEMIASVVWPTFLLIVALFLLLRIARQFAGSDAMLPALVIGAITLNLIGMFTPRDLDHHNLQLVLALATVYLLLIPGWRQAAAAGLCCTVMLAIGMETLPYVAIAGTCVAVRFLWVDRDGAAESIGFGLGFAVSAALALGATVPYSSWWAAQCDAYSAGLGSVAIIAGCGLAGTAWLTANQGIRGRFAAMAVLGCVVVAAALQLVPQCFGDPFVGMDPKLKKYWLDGITEAQPLWRMIENRPDSTPQNYATAFLAAGLLIASMLRKRIRREDAIVAAFLIGAILVSIWQVRGSNFSLPFAIIPLSAWVASTRRQVEAHMPGAPVRLAFAWLLSMNLVWGAAAHGIADIVAPDRASKVQAEKSNGNVDAECYADATFDDLARLPATTVLTISNLGSPTLSNTPHRVLSGPYHRNITGNLLALEAFLGSDDEALAIAKQQKATLLAFCPENGESISLADAAPQGFMAHLVHGKLPAWLEPIPQTMGGPLKLYRIR